MKKLRIAFGRLMQETNSFSSVDTTFDDFKKTHFLEGDDLLKACDPKEWEVKGYLKNLELSGFIKAVKEYKDIEIQVIPLFSAWAISGGPLNKNDFYKMLEILEDKLKKAGELDGVFFALHGALGVREEDDPEVKILQTIKNVIGDKPISSSFDLHGNITYEKLKYLDVLCSYRTNPHWDMASTGYRATKLLIDKLIGKTNPYKTWRYLPLLLGGGTTISFMPPMLEIFQRMNELEQIPEVLSISLFMVHPYIDTPEVGWTVHVITNNDIELAENIADELAERCWSIRKIQPPKMLEPEEMIKKVRNYKLYRKLGTITVCDASDVVGAGGTGENTNLLKFLLENAKDLVSLVPVRDPETLLDLWDKQENSDIKATIGGKLQPEFNPPIQVEGKIIAKKETEHFGKVILLDLNHVKLIVTEGAAFPLKPAFYEDLGLNIFKADIVIVKNFFHFKIYYFLKSRKSLYVKTSGITDFDIIKNIKTKYPCYPISNIENWKEIDKKIRRIETNVENEIKMKKTIIPKINKNDIIYLTLIFLLSFLLNKKNK
jgi:microcystin degradation protein MlrC